MMIWWMMSLLQECIDGSVQDNSKGIANALGLLQSWTEASV